MLEDTFKTPTGLHLVAAKIGSGLPAGALLNTENNKSVCSSNPSDNNDYITSRILRLSGLEDGINEGGNVDSYRDIHTYMEHLIVKCSEVLVRMAALNE